MCGCKKISVIGASYATALPSPAMESLTPMQAAPMPTQPAAASTLPSSPLPPATPPPAANTPVFSATDIANLNAAWNYAIQASNAASSWLQGFASTNALPAGMTIANYQAFIGLIRQCQEQEEQLFLNGQQIAPNPTIQGVQSLQIFASNGLSFANQFMAYFSTYPGLISALGNGTQIQELCQDAANAMSGPSKTAAAAVQAAITVANQGNAPAPPPPAAPPTPTPPPVISPPAVITPVVVAPPIDTSWFDQPSFIPSVNNAEATGGAIVAALLVGTGIYVATRKKKRR